jgi:hypothetical protein
MRIDSPLKADHSVLQASSKVGSVFAILSDLPGRVDWTKLAGCSVQALRRKPPMELSRFRPTAALSRDKSRRREEELETFQRGAHERDEP